MKMRVLLLGAFLLFAPLPFLSAQTWDARAQLQQLQVRVLKQEFQSEQLHRDLLAFCRFHVGTPIYAKAVEALARVPSPLDQLDAGEIDAQERKFLAIRELTAFVRPHHRSTAHVAISFDGRFLASSGWDNNVHVYKLGAKEPHSWAKLEGSPSGVAFSPDGNMLAAGCGDTRVLMWDLTGAKPIKKFALAGHKNRPFSVTFAPTGKMLTSGCYDPVLRIWKLDDTDPEAWAILANEKTPSLGISSMAFSHDGKFVVSGSHIGKETLRIWEAGNFLDEKSPAPAQARLIACSPVEPIFAFAGNDSSIHLWSLGGARIEKLRTISGHAGEGLPPIVKALAFSPDGKILASSGQDRRVRLWDVASGEKVREWHFLDEARALAFSSDGRHLAVGNSDGTLYVLRLESLKFKKE